ncbi:MAG: hypothetical protein Q9163_000679 [Psora crenata]
MVASRVCKVTRALRNFSYATTLRSGHNRWSKIKHDKAKVDVRHSFPSQSPYNAVHTEQASTTKQRSIIAEELQEASKAFGPDPKLNPRLAAVISAAKRQGFPKQSIENAIARGQGVSSSGKPLESLTIEALLPPSIAAIIECQTDSRLRTLADIRYMVKEAGGTVTPTNHLFDKRGKVVFTNPGYMSEQDIFDQAIEAGAIDITTADDGKIVVITEPEQTTAIAKRLSVSLRLIVESSEIMWVPKEEMMVEVKDGEQSSQLDRFLSK